MKIPLLDLKPQLELIEAELKSAVLEVIDSTRYIMGPKVEELEAQIAKYVGAKFGIGVSSGTDALLISLMALDIKPGDFVLTTGYSFFATAGVIARLGATPIFLDIDRDSYNLSPAVLNDFLNTCDFVNKIKAIVPVHLYGQGADMKSIIAISERFNIPVVEDAAQAIGTTIPLKDGIQKAGSIGAMGCFSFFPSKNLGGIGDGGMVVTNSEELALKLRKLRNHGAHPKYYHSLIGGNFRLDPIQAATLLVKLPHLEKWHTRRRENAAYYDKHLSSFPLKTPKIVHERSNHIYNQYVISADEDRDKLRAFLKENDISTEVYYPVPFHKQECFKYLHRESSLPNCEYAASHTLAIPIYPELTQEMQDYVISKIREYYE